MRLFRKLLNSLAKDLLSIMDERIKRIADSAGFRRMAAEKTIKGLACHYRVSETRIIKMLQYADVHCLEANTTKNDKAPTLEEEEASQRSLRFAPLVAERVQEVVRLHVQYMRGEIDGFPWDKKTARRNLNNGRAQGSRE